MGLNCVLDKQFSFIYKAKLDSDMIEYEHDTVFIGQTDDNPRVDSNEVRDYRYIDYQSLKNEISIKPNSFTPWFKLIIDKIDLNFFKVNKYFCQNLQQKLDP